MYTKFAVVPNGKATLGDPTFFLECEGNPTTLMTGNNVLPVTSRNPKTKALEPYPSSAHNVMTTLNRLLFRFLEDIAAQVTGDNSGEGFRTPARARRLGWTRGRRSKASHGRNRGQDMALLGRVRAMGI